METKVYLLCWCEKTNKQRYIKKKVEGAEHHVSHFIARGIDCLGTLGLGWGLRFRISYKIPGAPEAVTH